MTREFWKELDELNPNTENYVLTLLDGQEAGEKALLSNHRLFWTEKTDGFFRERREEVEAISESGVLELYGRQVYAELLGREKRLIICGAGHVSIAMIRIGKLMGCAVTVIEDRPVFAENARRAGADTVLCEDFTEALKALPSDRDCYFIIVTRGHRYDQDCLRVITSKPHAYIGMMGSKRRVRFVKEALEAEGIDRALLDSVYTPIGLSIGAETPEEIAVSVMAEIIQVKNRRRRAFGYPKEIVEGIVGAGGEAEEGQKLLCTIIRRKGSAPREIGTKMLLLPDRRCIGTIGGGCAEAEVVQRGQELLLGEERLAIFHVDLLDSAAAEEGMVCGGVLDVMAERV